MRARIIEWEFRLKMDFLITDATNGERLSKGSSVQVAIDCRTLEMCLSSPPVLLEKLGVAA